MCGPETKFTASPLIDSCKSVLVSILQILARVKPNQKVCLLVSSPRQCVPFSTRSSMGLQTIQSSRHVRRKGTRTKNLVPVVITKKKFTSTSQISTKITHLVRLFSDSLKTKRDIQTFPSTRSMRLGKKRDLGHSSHRKSKDSALCP